MIVVVEIHTGGSRGMKCSLIRCGCVMIETMMIIRDDDGEGSQLFSLPSTYQYVRTNTNGLQIIRVQCKG